MKKIIYFLSIASLICTSACTNQQIYDEVQRNQRMKCAKQPQSIYEECREKFSKPYEIYEREVEALFKKPPSYLDSD